MDANTAEVLDQVRKHWETHGGMGWSGWQWRDLDPHPTLRGGAERIAKALMDLEKELMRGGEEL